MLHKELKDAEEKSEQIKKRIHKKNDAKHLEVTEEDIAEEAPEEQEVEMDAD